MSDTKETRSAMPSIMSLQEEQYRQQVRVTCLNLAVQYVDIAGKDAEVMEWARAFYDFITEG